MSFKITGLTNTVMCVGDALFAHSQGGIYSRKDYQEALSTNRSSILSQADDTVLAPGHGPLTTVSHEKHNNPFYASNES
jgi:glyoxylase-like metal-dependent hydrolase (beta-lactamase superfamily II)